MTLTRRHIPFVLTGLLLVVCLCVRASRPLPLAPRPSSLVRDDYAKAFGSAFFDGNDFSKALAAYSQASAASLTEHDLCNYAMAAYFLQQYRKAFDISLFGLTQYPRQAALNRVAFFCATELKQYTDALRYADILFHHCDSVRLSYYDYLYYGRIQTIAKDYQKADSAYALLAAEYDNALEYATYMRAEVNAQMDPDQTQGLARPYYEQLAELLMAKPQPDDTDRKRLKESCLYLISYYFLRKDDKDKASHYAHLLLTIDPDNAIARHLLEGK